MKSKHNRSVYNNISAATVDPFLWTDSIHWRPVGHIRTCNNMFDSWQFRTESLISLKCFNSGCWRKMVFMRIKLKTYRKIKKVSYFNTFKFWASIKSCISPGVCVCVCVCVCLTWIMKSFSSSTSHTHLTTSHSSVSIATDQEGVSSPLSAVSVDQSLPSSTEREKRRG